VTYKVKTAEEGRIYSFLKECNDSFCPKLDTRTDIIEYSKKIFNNAVTFEAWSENDLVGLVAAYFNNTDDRSGYVTIVAISKDYLRQGIATDLMNMCINHAERSGTKEIKLEVYKTNLPAISVYNRFGFKKYTNAEDQILMKLEVTSS